MSLREVDNRDRGEIEGYLRDRIDVLVKENTELKRLCVKAHDALQQTLADHRELKRLLAEYAAKSLILNE